MKYVAGILATFFAAVMIHGQLLPMQNDLPAYHPGAPEKNASLPLLLTEQQLAQAGLTLPAQTQSYRAASKASSLMYQMPCFCHCDRHAGHSSLRSCFEGTHGANCSTCMEESLYVYQQSKKGWSAKMIRDGIIRGDFKTIDLENPQPVM